MNAYYYAGKALSAGIDPYQRQQFPEWRVDFVYPPAALPFCVALSRLTFGPAYYTYLGLKLAALAALIWLWRRRFLGSDMDAVFYLLCIACFNGAIHLDVRAGNVSVFEQLGLWLAFAAFLSGRLYTFAVLTAATASVKLTPVLFLWLLWFTNRPRRVQAAPFAAGVGAFALVHAVAYLAKPELTSSFIASVQKQTERGLGNPATWPALNDVFDATSQACALAVPAAVRFLAYGAVCISVVAASCRAMRRLQAAGEASAPVYVACLTYALIVPRFKDYSYILLIVPAFWAIQRFRSSPAYGLLALGLVFSPTRAELPGWQELMRNLVWPYYPLLLAYVLWAMALTWAEQRAPRPAPGLATSATSTLTPDAR